MRFCALAFALLAACSSSRRERDAAPAAPVRTVNEFLARGTPTFIVGTAGDDRADRAIAAQAGLVRTLFPGAPVVADTAVDRSAWPPNPVVYGAAHVNQLVAALDLPFTIAPGTLTVDTTTLRGDDLQLIAVVPAAADHPELLLFAGTGTPGVGEINSVSHGPDALQINDRFGRLATGTFVDGAPALGPLARRIEWRRAGAAAFPAQLPAAADEPDTVAAIDRAIAAAAARLGVTAPPITVHVYPDRRSKQSLTGNAGDGHAAVEGGAVHVIPAPPEALEPLVTHEATHAIAYRAWGAAGTPLLGEGLAVWASGRYAGRSLADWATRLGDAPSIAELLTAFRRTPEPTAYPLAGLLVDAAVATVGLAAVRDHLYGASATDWDAACRAAGTTAEALQQALDTRLAR